MFLDKKEEKNLQRNRQRKQNRKIKKAKAKYEEVKAKEEKVAKLECVALDYIKEKESNEKLKEQIKDLTQQLCKKNYARKKGFTEIRKGHSEYLISKMPALCLIDSKVLDVKRTTIGSGAFGTVYAGFLKTIDLPVAVKKSKCTSLIAEAHVMQASSGHENFLHFFGCTLDNAIVMQLIQIYDKETLSCYSPTVNRLLSSKIRCRYNWEDVCKGIINAINYLHRIKIIHNDIKEDNILVQTSNGYSVPKLFDFGKATHSDKPLVYSLSEELKRKYNLYHRHIAYELRNFNGYKQSFLTDAFSVGRVFKAIGKTLSNNIILEIASKLKVDNPQQRTFLAEITL